MQSCRGEPENIGSFERKCCKYIKTTWAYTKPNVWTPCLVWWSTSFHFFNSFYTSVLESMTLVVMIL